MVNDSLISIDGIVSFWNCFVHMKKSYTFHADFRYFNLPGFLVSSFDNQSIGRENTEVQYR